MLVAWLCLWRWRQMLIAWLCLRQVNDPTMILWLCISRLTNALFLIQPFMKARCPLESDFKSDVASSDRVVVVPLMWFVSWPEPLHFLCFDPLLDTCTLSSCGGYGALLLHALLFDLEVWALFVQGLKWLALWGVYQCPP
jgi:hypothetical protein